MERQSHEFFYVIPDECISCGAPIAVAPDLMDWTPEPNSRCHFKRQPETPGELSQAIDAINACCCGNVAYYGSDPKILAALRMPRYAKPNYRPWISIDFNRAYRSRSVAGRILAAVAILLFIFFVIESITVSHPTNAGFWGCLAILYVSITLYGASYRA